MKAYPVNSTGMKISMVTIGIILILLGLAFANFDTSAWIRVVGAIGVGFVILAQVGVKRWTDLSDLDSVSYSQFLSIITATIIVTTGVLNIPQLNVQWGFINSATSVALIAGGALFIKEAFY